MKNVSYTLSFVRYLTCLNLLVNEIIVVGEVPTKHSQIVSVLPKFFTRLKINSLVSTG